MIKMPARYRKALFLSRCSRLEVFIQQSRVARSLSLAARVLQVRTVFEMISLPPQTGLLSCADCSDRAMESNSINEAEVPLSVTQLAEQVEADGGQLLSIYREPVGGRWQIFALLPISLIDPTPFQRDISRAHAERLKQIIKKLDRFIDPIVVVRNENGRYWTPNGNHRREALIKLKVKFAPVILVPDQSVAFKILALNTEKAHNLKEKSLEVIRMYRALADASPSKSEEDFAFEFEEAYYITLGLLYERHPRFVGGAFSPILRRVDKFMPDKLSQAIIERDRRADLVDAASDRLTQVAERLKKRGINHPYLKNFLVARSNPLTRARKRLPDFDTTFSKLAQCLENFDTSTVTLEEIARAAVAAEQ
jgi:ParB family chromosome partitioning protein